MSDAYLGTSTSSATGSFDITPDDETTLPYTTRAIYIGGDGDLALRLVDDPPDEHRIWRNVVAGSELNVQAVAVLETGTTATDLIGYR